MLNAIEKALWALNANKAGRPPLNKDGTPAEMLSDQILRLTNLMSVLEMLYSGDNIGSLLLFSVRPMEI